MEELTDAVTELYGSMSLKGALPGGTWKDASKNLVIELAPLADQSSPEEHPDAMQGDPSTRVFNTDAFHDSVGRSVPRKELKEQSSFPRLALAVVFLRRSSNEWPIDDIVRSSLPVTTQGLGG
jgi:hypothetical protein